MTCVATREVFPALRDAPPPKATDTSGEQVDVPAAHTRYVYVPCACRLSRSL